MFGAFPAIGFLAMDRDSNLANWFNGFLTTPLVLQFWPRQDQTVGFFRIFLHLPAHGLMSFSMYSS